MFVGVGGGSELVDPTVTKKEKKLILMLSNFNISTSGLVYEEM